MVLIDSSWEDLRVSQNVQIVKDWHFICGKSHTLDQKEQDKLKQFVFSSYNIK